VPSTPLAVPLPPAYFSVVVELASGLASLSV